MANYNFTMKEFNGTSYDTLYPKTTSQQVLLNDSVLATKLGLSSDANLHDLLTDSNLAGQIVSYTGNGLYGVDNPCSITFSMPVDVILWVGNYWKQTDVPTFEQFTIVMAKESVSYQEYHGFTQVLQSYGGGQWFGKKSEDNKTYSWYCSGNANDQLNQQGEVYYFLGIGGVKST